LVQVFELHYCACPSRKRYPRTIGMVVWRASA
jgi:hypothetical protein